MVHLKCGRQDFGACSTAPLLRGSHTFFHTLSQSALALKHFYMRKSFYLGGADAMNMCAAKKAGKAVGKINIGLSALGILKP